MKTAVGEAPRAAGTRDYTVPSVATATRMLRWLRGRTATLSEISAATEVSKSTAYGILKTLQQEGFVHYEAPTRAYRLGHELLALGESAADALDHVASLKPSLRVLVAQTGLTGLVAQPASDQLLVVHKEEGTAEVRATSSVGRLLPLGAGAMGKAYLAFTAEDPKPVGRRFRPPAFTPKSITNPARFATELETIRKRGYATSFEEYRLGVNAVAAPVFDHRGRVVLLVSLIGFASVLTPKAIGPYGERLRATCSRASRALGADAR